MADELVVADQTLAPYDDIVAAAGQAANAAAEKVVFQDFTARKARNTRVAHLDNLDTFSRYLWEVTGEQKLIPGERLLTEPETWRGITWGLVEAYKRWLLEEGYAINSVNRKLSCVRSYARLAERAGAISPDAGRLIASVTGYGHTEGLNIDAERPNRRKGHKKPKSIPLTVEQVRQLKQQPDTPQGRRDRVIICLLADHGLRVGELAAIQAGAFNLNEQTFTFYRQKVGIEQTHELSPDAFMAVKVWFDRDGNTPGPLLRASRRGGINVTKPGMTEQAITRRVRELGRRIGIKNLGSHDLRHYWATDAARNGTSIEVLISAGGWTSAATALRYIDAAKIANKGIRESR